MESQVIHIIQLLCGPTLRDNAQDARNTLVEILLKTPGKQTFLAIHEIAEAFPERPWLARLAQERAERDGDLDAIDPAGVRELNDKLERTPANHRELAELAVFRLIDLKDDLENGDSSIAAILRKVTLETDMRKLIGKELRVIRVAGLRQGRNRPERSVPK